MGGNMKEDNEEKTCVFAMVRHGKTKGNEEARYMGRTDEGLSERGREEILKRDYSSYQNVEKVFVSPLKRCLETADLVFPGKPREVVPGFIECDFGDFEYKNYKEMEGNRDYQAWVDSGGKLPFPHGEDVEEFKDRCALAMKGVIDSCRKEGITCAGLLIHGGVIMSIMERLCSQKKSYYDWHPENGSGYLAKTEGDYGLKLLENIF